MGKPLFIMALGGGGGWMIGHYLVDDLGVFGVVLLALIWGSVVGLLALALDD